jgi:hypothetical protein
MSVRPRAHLRLVASSDRPGLAKTRARAIDAQLGDMLTELGRLADEAACDDETFRELANAVAALGRARTRLHEPR